MAAPWNPPTKNEDFEFDVSLEDWLNPGLFKANPTLASGDVKIIKNNGASANLTTLPTVEPASGPIVRVQVSQTEMNTDKVTIVFADQTSPPEWASLTISINTSA